MKKKRNINKNLDKFFLSLLNICIIIITLYIFFISFGSFVIPIKLKYFIDIGSKQESKVKGIEKLTPHERVGTAVEGNPDFRELQHAVVYSKIDIPFNTKQIQISLKFKNNFPEDSKGFYIGAQNKEGWNYIYKPIFLSYFKLPENTQFIQENNKRLIFINKEKPVFKSIDEFLNNIPRGSVISTNLDIKPKPIKIENYKPGNLDINIALRGNHTLYIYAKDNLNLEITKQDINWYKNEDTLTIKISDSERNLIKQEIIPDDGEAEASKITKTAQTKILKIPDIKEGVYKIELLNNADTFIKRIKINQGKLVIGKSVHLVDNKLFKITETKPTKFYTKINRDSNIDFLTYHKEGLQDVLINKRPYKIAEVNKKLQVPIKASKDFIEIYSPQNDIIVSGAEFFSFTKDSYFEPYEYTVTGLENYKIADYILTDYKEPVKDGEWLIGTATFDIKEVYVKDGKLSIMLNARHLSDPKYKEYTVPVDWIKATLYRGPK